MTAPPCSPETGHAWRWCGPTLDYRDGEHDCEHPVVWKCMCGARRTARCMAHRASRCRPCAARYRGRVARLAEAGANRRNRYGYLLTLTAPSPAQHRRWRPNRQGSVPPGPCRCSEALRVADWAGDERAALGAWNASAGRRWHHVATSLRDHTEIEFFRTVEVQARGAIHAHVLVLSADRLSPGAVQQIALRAGWGCVMDLAVLDPGRHARYVAKYVSKGCDDRDDLPWLTDVADEVTGEIRPCWTRPTFRSWSASRGWGLTMAALVLRAQERMIRQARAENQAAVIRVGVRARPAAGTVTSGGP